MKQVYVREIVDCDTGEIKVIESQKVFTKKVKSDNFYFTFIDFIAPLFRLRSDSAKTLLVWLCTNAEFNTGVVRLTADDRRQLCETLNMSNNAITNCLKKLKDLNLISGQDGKFTINPQIFWKGEMSVRDKLLQSEDIQIIFKLGE
jgi:hypothetical protein